MSAARRNEPRAQIQRGINRSWVRRQVCYIGLGGAAAGGSVWLGASQWAAYFIGWGVWGVLPLIDARRLTRHREAAAGGSGS